MQIISPLTDRGVPLEHAMIQAAPPFPVAGFSWFTDDWGFPRYIPTPHLHEGTDIIADAGTPILASGPGTLVAMNTTPVGGNIIWIVGDNADSYYYAHLERFAEGLQVGQRVESGTVIGYVGNTGNAIGSVPHLHMEIHPAIRDASGNIVASGVTVGPTGAAQSNTPPVNPKPYLDQWLAEAEARAQQLVLQLIQRLAGLTRQIHYSQRVEDLFELETAAPPEQLLWFSPLEPSLGVVGIARATVLDSVIGERTGSIRSAEEQRLSAVRIAMQSVSIKFANLIGGFHSSGTGSSE